MPPFGTGTELCSQVLVTVPPKAMGSYVFCGKPGHSARGCRTKHDGLACCKCGQEGHKANVCTNAVVVHQHMLLQLYLKKTAANYRPKHIVESCTTCQRYGHNSESCWIKACPECNSLFQHDSKRCDGLPNHFSCATTLRLVRTIREKMTNLPTLPFSESPKSLWLRMSSCLSLLV